MRMVHAIQENTTEGSVQVKQTGVGGDAKIVYALLTGMVSDKVEYPVREIATNAWEVSPNGRPFEIELPTKWNMEYRVRDFGPGLPHRFMMDRYAKIGESTKDGDDDAVGGWGFGSKSPLAYLMRSDGAGSFTAISRHRGFRRTYSIGVSETGKIQIQFLGEWPLDADDRGTGLEIMFPVRPDDVQRFHDHAKAILWSFHPRPKITPAIDFGEARVLHQGDGWKLYDSSTVPFSGPQIQLGPVMYPIDMALAPYSGGWVEGDDCLVFEAKIGSVSVSASRENLQYDDRTEAGLKELFAHYSNDWMEKARVQVDAQPTYFRARWKAMDIADSLGKRGWGLVRAIGWRGFNFTDELFKQGGPVKATLWPEVKPHHPDEPLAFKARWGINPGELQDRKVVIQHGSTRTMERWVESGLLDTPCLWVRVKRADLDVALDQMGRPEYVVLDDIKLPKGQRIAREKRPESMVKRKILSLDLRSAKTQWVDTDDELIMLTVRGRGKYNRYVSTYTDGKFRDWGLYDGQRVIQDAISLDLIDRDIQLVLVDQYEEVPEHWIHFGDYLAEKIDETLDPTQVAPTIPWNSHSFPTLLRKIGEAKVDLGAAPQKIRDLYYGMVAMLKTREDLVREETVHDRLAKLNLKVTGTDVKSVAKDPTQPINEGWAEIEHNYPLLPMILSNLSYYGKISRDQQRKLDHYFSLIQ